MDDSVNSVGNLLGYSANTLTRSICKIYRATGKLVCKSKVKQVKNEEMPLTECIKKSNLDPQAKNHILQIIQNDESKLELIRTILTHIILLPISATITVCSAVLLFIGGVFMGVGIGITAVVLSVLYE
jgi:hypothetical protein